MLFARKPTAMPTPSEALAGRDEPMSGLGPHLVLGTRVTPPFPEGFERIVVGMAASWGGERPF